MKKLLTTAFIVLACATNSYADEFKQLILWKANGERVNISLEEYPRVTFTSDEVLITTHMNDLSFPANDVVRFTYGTSATDIANVTVDNQTSFSLTDNRLSISNIKSNSTVTVYQADGALITSQKTDKSGNVTINIESYQPGVYLVKTSSGNFKIRKP